MWRGGPNGLFLVVLSLAWWLWAASKNDEPLEDVLESISDVAWVLHLAVTSMTHPVSQKRPIEDANEASTVINKHMRTK